MATPPANLQLYRSATLLRGARQLITQALDAVPLEQLHHLPRILGDLDVGYLLEQAAEQLEIAAIEETILEESKA